MIGGFTNDVATFFEEIEDDGSDPYDPASDGDSTTSDPWEPSYQDVSVRSEQQDAEYVRDAYGEVSLEVYRLFVAPTDVGEHTQSGYELGLEANQRVELESISGRFELQPPNLQRLDSDVPEFVQVEVTKVGD